VHLSRKADAGDRVAANGGAGERSANRQAAGAPPIARILFGPTGARRCERRVLLDAGAENAAVRVDDQGARSAGAHVDAENLNGRDSFSLFIALGARLFHRRYFKYVASQPASVSFQRSLFSGF
jgi:hypothetical protein